MKTYVFNINNHKIHATVEGTGPPILLINGLGGDDKIIEPLRKALDGYTTIVFHPPGVGKSSSIFWPLRIRHHADIAVEVLNLLGIDKPIVFGVSWGGAVAQEIARRHPERISKLILASTTTGPTIIVKPKILVDRMYRMLTGTDLMQILAVLGWTSLHWLSDIEHSTLVISGEEDVLILPYNARVLDALLPNSKLVIISDADHYMVMTHPKEVAQEIKNFMK